MYAKVTEMFSGMRGFKQENLPWRTGVYGQKEFTSFLQ